MRHRVSLLALLVLLLTFPTSIHAQQNSWQSLQEAKTGQKVTVVDRQMNTYKGQLVHCTDTDLTVRVAGQSITLDRENVVRVTITGHRRVRNALIGLVVGAASALVIDAATFSQSEWSNHGGTVAGDIGGLAVVGAGIGALFPGSRTVYRASEKKQAAIPSVSIEPPPVHAQ